MLFTGDRSLRAKSRLRRLRSDTPVCGRASNLRFSSDRHEKNRNAQRASRFFGAGDRTRTGTRLPARDFKSLVSTIPPHRQVYGHFSTLFPQRQGIP